MRVVISEAKFRELVAGRAFCWTGSHQVELVLSNVSHQAMIEAIIAALVKPHEPPPDPPQAKEFLPLKRRNNRK